MDKSDVILQYLAHNKDIGVCDAIEEIYSNLDLESKIELLDEVEDLLAVTYENKVIH